QLPTQAFEQRIAQELQENPALERGKEEEDSFENEYDTDNYDDNYDDGNEVIETDFDVDEYLSDDEIHRYKLSANNYSADDEEREIPFAAGMSFKLYLYIQLNICRLEADEKEIARFLVGSIDESGYLRRESQEIVDDLAFTQNLYTTE